MNRFFTLLFFIFFSLVSHTQPKAPFAVTSFKELNDQTAFITKLKDPMNGKYCAIIKILTPVSGIEFKGDMSAGIVKLEKTAIGYTLWVPPGARQITFTHASLGSSVYNYELSIEEMKVYEMQLASANVKIIVEETINAQWLIINAEPVTAMIYINDGQYEAAGEFQKKLQPGKYTCRVEAPLYHTENKTIELTLDKRSNNSITLKPNFGYAQISTKPESDAKITIDGGETPYKTPFTTDKLKSGEHYVMVSKPMYKTQRHTFTITDEQTTPVDITLQPNFATLEIVTTTDASIVINNQSKGKSTWSGRLDPGVYNLEARKENHTPAKQDIELTAGDNRTITLEPLPIYGNLDIMTKPSGATIKLSPYNGTIADPTPNTISKLLIGTYTITLSKPGYGTLTKQITITEGTTTEVNETLPSGALTTIESKPMGAQLSIDGVAVGTTPYSTTLSFGNHTIKMVNGKKTIEGNITVKQDSKNEFTADVSEIEYITETTAGLNLDMVAVRGGTFSMGGTESDEKPIHSVTLSDFYIGKTEVTQAQWVAIMGSNPSNFKDDNLPVERVSWNDIQEFLKKLNARTGKTYRLPTEAEWEYAARGGSQSKGYTYSGSNNIGDVAWFTDNSNNQTHAVGSKIANELGIFDMSGNVWEWCSDWYASDYYTNSPSSNPTGAALGPDRVVRGGSWINNASGCRVAMRDSDAPDDRHNSIGFRFALSSSR